MNGFREKLSRFMYGRYGFDAFGRFLFWLAFAFWIICFIVRFFTGIAGVRYVYSALSFLNTAIYVYAIFRILSRNIYKRSLENERYLRFRTKALPFIEKHTENLRDREHVYKKCPKCKAKLRLPRKKGKHITRCPKCGTKFNVRVFFEYNGGFNEPYDYR